MNKQTLYIDMDGPTVDFESGIDQLDDATKEKYAGRLDEVPGIFGLMKPTVGAIEAITLLAEHFDVYFLSTAPWGNPSALSDKVLFIQEHFPVIGYKRLILSHNKHLNRGDYLIDDRPNNGAAEFHGEWVKYGTTFYQNHPNQRDFAGWDDILAYLLPYGAARQYAGQIDR